METIFLVYFCVYNHYYYKNLEQIIFIFASIFCNTFLMKSVFFNFRGYRIIGDLENDRHLKILLYIKKFPQGRFERILDMLFYKKNAF